MKQSSKTILSVFLEALEMILGMNSENKYCQKTIILFEADRFNFKYDN